MKKSKMKESTVKKYASIITLKNKLTLLSLKLYFRPLTFVYHVNVAPEKLFLNKTKL